MQKGNILVVYQQTLHRGINKFQNISIIVFVSSFIWFCYQILHLPKFMKKQMLILFSVLFLSSFAKANVDKYYFEQISLHEGLSQSTVKAIFRDHMGMLWIGTREGLNRYDGQTIRTYLNDPHSANSLPDNNIFHCRGCK